MNSLALVSIGGVAGTLTRFALGEIFPNDRTGTLVANIFGVGLAAILLVWMERSLFVIILILPFARKVIPGRK